MARAGRSSAARRGPHRLQLSGCIDVTSANLNPDAICCMTSANAEERRHPPMPATQSDKAKQFRTLHEAPGAFVIANVWDGGSARMMATLGFAALATSIGASAGFLGRRDGRVTRAEALAQAWVVCDATDLPVSADLVLGFGDSPE